MTTSLAHRRDDVPAAVARARRRSMYLRMVTRSVLRRRSRVLVAVLAVALGAATLSGLVALVTQVPAELAREFRSYGANLAVLPDGSGRPLDDDAVAAVTALMPADGLVGVAPARYATARVHSQPVDLVGTDLAAARAVDPFWQVTGAWPAGPEEALVGVDVAALFGVAPGDDLPVVTEGADGTDVTTPLAVAGVLSTGGAEDGAVYLDHATLDALSPGDGYDLVEVSVSGDSAQVERLAAAIEDAVPGAAATPVRRVTQSEATVLGTLGSLLWIVAVVVLALTAVTVATTMAAVVTERRREIGLRKALGAQGRAVVGEFLGEAALVGAAGGLAGAALGLGFARVVSDQVFGRAPGVDLSSVPVTVLAAVALTVAASTLPVRRAADVDPAAVLRGE